MLKKNIFIYFCQNYNTDEIEKNINEIINRADTNKTYIIKAIDSSTYVNFLEYKNIIII